MAPIVDYYQDIAVLKIVSVTYVTAIGHILMEVEAFHNIMLANPGKHENILTYNTSPKLAIKNQ